MTQAGLLLAPGAGADRNQSALVAIDTAAAAAGLLVKRMDFPYRIAGRRAPDRPAVLLRSVAEAVADLARRASPIAAGGRSMGGRMCSMAAADGLDVAALALVSYPLHPPGRPDRLRTGHFPRLTMPCLFVSGTRDAFGSPTELEAATALIPGPVAHVWFDGRDHSMRGADADVAAAVIEWLATVAGFEPRGAGPAGSRRRAAERRESRQPGVAP